MILETNQHLMSQGDQDLPSMYGLSPSLRRCLMAHQEVLWYQLIWLYSYTPQQLRNKLDHHILELESLILFPKHLWLMMELQKPSPMTRMMYWHSQDNLKKS